MNKYLLYLLIILNFILQTTIFQYFRIAGILPNTALILVIIISLLNGRKKGITAGILAGLLQDFFFSRAIGINLLIYLFISYFIGGLEKKLFKDNLLTPIFLIAVSTIFYYLIYCLILYFLNYSSNFWFVLKKVTLFEMVYNITVGIFVYKWFYYKYYVSK
ncbi:rod shape-determining protein MreD [Caminicella sporogenes]|uniref:rod shape-determining protein MreD n=1 Tax=Caminicella sporogenes TaxID=166485 RepID=UPI002540CAA9|nr:rod shape-determining protein MreD [Caminicella sporogenes]WIF94421.1 rod shape-determining protein MreD [Caminicella sporogenes]